MERNRRWLVLLTLAAWVVLGPIGMAFGACGAIMLLCDGSPCGLLTALMETTPTAESPRLLAIATRMLTQHPIAVLPSALEPPPKLVRLPA
jgi:hypothetical protein